MAVSLKDCNKFKSNPHINPLTNQPIKIGSLKYKELEKKCKKYGLTSPLINGKYQLIKILGKGTFGVTYKAIDIKTNKEVSIKILNDKAYLKHTHSPTIEEEIDVLKDLSSQGECLDRVICYNESFKQEWEGNPSTFIISDYIEGITLQEFLNKHPSPVSLNLFIPLVTQLILGLYEIHEKGYAHRDIKPANIMITPESKIVYIDFGLSCLSECKRSGCNNLCTHKVGSLLYDPPEYYNGNFDGSYEQALTHDIWSLGVILFQLTDTREFPFVDNHNKEILKRNIAAAPIYECDYIHDFKDKNVSTFIDTILNEDWKQRPTIQDIYSDFIENIVSKFELPSFYFSE